jgi:hypothetical protein
MIADFSKASASEIQDEIARRQGVLLLGQLDRMQEAMGAWDNWVSPREPYYDDPTGEIWHGTGGADPDDVSSGFQSEEELALARRATRVLAMENGYAQSGHKNRRNYVVGTGHKYRATSKDPDKPADELVSEVQTVIDAFADRNDWYTRQGENQWRLDRDGEVFLRFFVTRDGLIVRTIEPGQIFQSHGEETDTFGIKTDPSDVEDVKGYWVDEEFVPASVIQHRKANVDKNVKRGCPTFWPVRHDLDRAYKLLRNMTVVTTTQASIAMIRKIGNVSKDALGSFISGKVDHESISRISGKTEQYEDFTRPGRILTQRGGMEYEFPIVGVNASEMVGVLDAELRCIASCLVMPEWMFAANARNNNMASSIVAGSPAYRNFESLQHEMMEDDEKILWLELQLAVRQSRISATIEQIREAVEIHCTPPTIENLDPESRTKKNQILKLEGILSPQTWSEMEGLDYDTEQQNRVAHVESYGDMLGDGIQTGDDQEEGADTKDDADAGGEG